MASDQFSLCWDNFQKNVTTEMQSLFDSEDLVDVTLAVEGRFLKAHKMVLSMCSPYFREMFQTAGDKQPIIFMHNVSYIAISDLLQFMYRGEVQVAQENLSAFIKTAEALQIKGLTGDGAQNDSVVESTEIDRAVVVETPVTTTTVKRSHEPIETKASPVARVKRPMGPASKRPRFSAAVAEPKPTIVSNTSPVSTVVTTTHKVDVSAISADDMIQFKMEPSEIGEQGQVEVVGDGNEKFGDGSEKYGDDSTVDDLQDDTEDYSLLETDDEPKPGTSADGTGDGQDFVGKLEDPFKSSLKRKQDMPRYIVDGFVFHVNIMKGKPPMTYLRCLEYKRLGCHARAIIPHKGNIQDIKLKKPHNHPPDFAAEEKIVFLRELKEVLVKNPYVSIKDVYSALSETYPIAAREIPFNLIRHKMNRWRRNIIAPL